LEINKNKKSSHCGTNPKKIAFGIAPLGIISIGIVPMGVISIGVVPMGVFSFGAVAMGIVNLSLVGMGIISAGLTTMGIWEYSPNSKNNHHNHSKQISNQNNGRTISDLFDTKQEADKAASKYGCIGSHKMGDKWMPCKMH
tara:strand:- start:79 stop:501 length:423 start_codon:yes stop_codon:yes gene_type:complete